MVGEIPPLMLCQGSNCNYRSQSISGKINKDGTTLSQQLQYIMLHIHQNNICILYKPGPDLYIASLLFCHNQTENKDKKVAGMSISIHTFSMAMDVPVCTSIEDFRNVISIDTELQILHEYIIRGWLQEKII